MREMLNPSEEKNIDSVSFENLQTLENVLKVCDGFYSDLTDLLLLRDETEERGKNTLREKLRGLGNKYQEILVFHAKKNYRTKEGFDKCFSCVQDFLVELGDLLTDIIGKTKRGENQLVDGFVEKMFELNDSFCELNRAINYQENAAFHVSLGLNGDSDYSYNTNFGVPETYDDVIGKFRVQKEGNKRLGVNVYRPLLELVDKELEDLLGKSGEEGKPLSEEDFREVSKDLFIMDYLNIKSYKDFCKKYAVLKDKQKTLSELKQKIDGIFMERGDSKSDLNVEGLHMNNLESFLKVRFRDLATQALVKVFDKKRRHN